MTLTYGTLVRLPESDTDVRTVAYEVDAVDGDEVTLRRVGTSSVAPFFLSLTAEVIEARVAAGTAEVVERDPSRRSTFAPPGECVACDRDREAESTFRPSHDAMAHCESGRRSHCTCGRCW